MPDIFYSENIAELVEAMNDEDRHQLPFGAIRLDSMDIVQFYSHSEAKNSGMGQRDQIGKGFFSDLAPCLATDDYLGKIEQARRSGDVDIEMGWVGDFSDEYGEMVVRIVSAPEGGLWIFHLRESEGAAA